MREKQQRRQRRRQNSGKIQMCNTSCRLKIITVLTAVVRLSFAVVVVVFAVLDLPISISVQVRVFVCIFVDEVLNKNRI